MILELSVKCFIVVGLWFAGVWFIREVIMND